MNKTVKCPKCNSENVSFVRYTMLHRDPSKRKQQRKKMKDEGVVCYGDVITDKSPRFVCRDCRHIFGSFTEFRKELKRLGKVLCLEENGHGTIAKIYQMLTGGYVNRELSYYLNSDYDVSTVANEEVPNLSNENQDYLHYEQYYGL